MQGRSRQLPQWDTALPWGSLRGDELCLGCDAWEELWEAVSNESPVAGDWRRLFQERKVSRIHLFISCAEMHDSGCSRCGFFRSTAGLFWPCSGFPSSAGAGLNPKPTEMTSLSSHSQPFLQPRGSGWHGVGGPCSPPLQRLPETLSVGCGVVGWWSAQEAFPGEKRGTA